MRLVVCRYRAASLLFVAAVAAADLLALSRPTILNPTIPTHNRSRRVQLEIRIQGAPKVILRGEAACLMFQN